MTLDDVKQPLRSAHVLESTMEIGMKTDGDPTISGEDIQLQLPCLYTPAQFNYCSIAQSPYDSTAFLFILQAFRYIIHVLQARLEVPVHQYIKYVPLSDTYSTSIHHNELNLYKLA